MAYRAKTLCMAAIALSLFVGVQSARASLVANLINGSNTFHDNSVAYALASDGTTVLAPNAVLTQGDYLVGVASIQSNDSIPATISGALDIVFAYQITQPIGAPGGSGVGPNYVPVTLGDGALSTTILRGLLSGGQFAALSPSSSASYAVVSSNNSFNVTTLSRTGSTPTTGTFAAINANYVLDAYGNVGTGNNNFDQAQLSVNYSTTSPGQTIGVEQGILNMTYHPGFAVTPDSSIDQLFAPYTLTSGDVALYSPLSVATAIQLTNAWSYSDDAKITIDAQILPEPTTLVVWSLLIAAGGFLSVRAAKKRVA